MVSVYDVIPFGLADLSKKKCVTADDLEFAELKARGYIAELLSYHTSRESGS
jgi:hypothetical protein